MTTTADIEALLAQCSEIAQLEDLIARATALRDQRRDERRIRLEQEAAELGLVLLPNGSKKPRRKSRPKLEA